MRKLTWKGIEAMPDKLWFWTFYKDWVKLTDEQKQKIPFDQLAQATAPQTEEEWKEYYYERQAERQLEEMMN